MDPWMADKISILHPFNSISVISEQWVGDNKRLLEMEICLQLKDFSLQESNSQLLDQQARA